MFAPPEEPMGLERVQEIVESQERVLEKHEEALKVLILEIPITPSGPSGYFIQFLIIH